MSLYVYLDLARAKHRPDKVYVADSEGESIIYNSYVFATNKEDAIQFLIARYGKLPPYGLFLKNNESTRRALNQEEMRILLQ